MTNTDVMRQRWEAVMMNNYGTPAMALASGDGAVLTDVDGRSYLDLLGGIAVNVLGHRHPAIIEAVTHNPLHDEIDRRILPRRPSNREWIGL